MKAVPTGWNMLVRHPDGMVAEYVEHHDKNPADEIFLMLRDQMVEPGISRPYCQKSETFYCAREGEQENWRGKTRQLGDQRWLPGIIRQPVPVSASRYTWYG